MSANEYVQLLRLLTGAGVEFVIVGGTAAIFHGASMAAYDLDVLMPFTADNCARLLQAMSGIHPRLSHTVDKRALQLSAEELAGSRNLHLLTDCGRLDVLGSLPPLSDTRAIMRRAEPMEIDRLAIRVLSLEDLIAVKAAMDRPKDKLVAAELRAIADVRASTRKR